MPRNGPQPREGESERSVTTRLADTTENESATTAESARGIAQRAVFFGQRAVLFKTVFSALVFDSCGGVYNPQPKSPRIRPRMTTGAKWPMSMSDPRGHHGQNARARMEPSAAIRMVTAIILRMAVAITASALPHRECFAMAALIAWC